MSWNVLLITADQMRADALGCAGNSQAHTPHLDALARQSVRFANHYGQASPCGPSRACLLTGMYLHNHRSVQNGTPLDARFTNLALEARALGYAPALFGYTDTSPDPRGRAPNDPALRSYEGILPGFDPVCPMLEDAAPWLSHLRAQGYDTSVGLRALYTPEAARHDGELWGPARYRDSDSDTAFLTDRFLDWQGEQGDGWFAHLSYIRPHPPWLAPLPWHDMFAADEMPAPQTRGSLEETAALHPWVAWRLANQTRENWVFGRSLDPANLSRAQIGQIRATYAALVAEIDHHVGRILAQLRAAGTLERTLVIFTSDHGELLGDHYMLGKEAVFPQAFHLPLIIHDPRREADATRGQVVSAFTEAVDIMPTILAWLGAAAPGQCDGFSLLAFIEGHRPAGWRDAAHYAIDFRDIALGRPERFFGLPSEACSFNASIDGTHLYVHFAGLPPLLLSMEEGAPWRNLALEPAHAPLARDQAMRLLSWRMRAEDQTLANLLLTETGVVARQRNRASDSA